MASHDTKTAKRTTTTTYWTRRYVFACNHTTDRYYPVKDATTDGQFKVKRVPLLLPVRLGRDCSACLRREIFERVHAKANDVRFTFNSLCAKLDRPKTTGDGLDEPLLVDEDAGADDEVWPEAPPSLESLSRLYMTKVASFETESDAGSEFTVKAKTATSPAVRHEKLSDQIRSIREDLEHRRQAWESRPR
ncbi:RFC checkpoint protein Rad17 [Sporothrix stenoceras]|uniref:RFC checkpoint protein Rad17 n=1 Tax=Sporothrix stenoceras TaxID=5173 RepID=A0ABR3ZMZ4_9PEZI